MNLKFVSEIAVVLLSAFFVPFYAIRFTSIPGTLAKTAAVIKPERPSPTMHILCFIILKFLTLS